MAEGALTGMGAAQPTSEIDASPCGRIVRAHDHDRYLASLVLPDQRREAVFAVYAFNHEVARIPEAATEVLTTQIRYQWWSDMIAEAFDGAQVRSHEVATPLARTIRRFGLPREPFETLLRAREEGELGDAAQPADMTALEAYCDDTASVPFLLALHIVAAEEVATAHERPAVGLNGANDSKAVRHMGIAWGLAGTLRAAPHLARRRRCRLPLDLLVDGGVALGDIHELRTPEGLPQVIQTIAAAASGHVASARALRPVLSPQCRRVLSGCTLVDAHLRRLKQVGYRPFDPRLSFPPPLRVLPMALKAWLGRY